MVALGEFRQKHPENAGIVLCGDFNSVPTDPAYELLVSGGLGKENMKVIESGNHITVRLDECPNRRHLVATIRVEHFSYVYIQNHNAQINYDGVYYVSI